MPVGGFSVGDEVIVGVAVSVAGGWVGEREGSGVCVAVAVAVVDAAGCEGAGVLWGAQLLKTSASRRLK